MRQEKSESDDDEEEEEARGAADVVDARWMSARHLVMSGCFVFVSLCVGVGERMRLENTLFDCQLHIHTQQHQHQHQQAASCADAARSTTAVTSIHPHLPPDSAAI